MADTIMSAAEPRVAGGLCSCALAALADLLPEGASSAEASFLRAHAAASARSGMVEDPADAPLLALGRQFGLRPVELLAVALAAAVEMDLMCGRAVSHLQAPLGGSRPTLGLLASAFAGFSAGEQVIETILTGAAVESGLLHVLNEGAPLAERTLSVPIPLCLALGGGDAVWPGSSLGLYGIPETPLPASVLAEARRQARGLIGGLQALVVRCGAIAEGKAVACAIASALGRRPLFVDMERGGNHSKAGPNLYGLGPLLLLRDLVPVFCFEPGPGERRAVPVLPCYSGPVLALCGQDGSVEARGESPAAWRIGVPGCEERRQLWGLAIGHDRLAAQLASDYRHGSGRIAQLGRLVRQQCLLDGRDEPAFSDIAAASWAGQGPGMEALAQPLPDLIPDGALVAGTLLREELSASCCAAAAAKV